VWGKNDPFFLPRGAEAFKRDIPGAVVRFFDTGHFALETHTEEIATAIRDFLTALVQSCVFEAKPENRMLENNPLLSSFTRAPATNGVQGLRRGRR
jgi:hypothetical protein